MELRDAGVTFWMLTGDKYTTALQIATACNLHAIGQPLISLEGKESAAELLDHMSHEIDAHKKAKGHQRPTIIATTLAIRHIMKEYKLREAFLKLSRMSECVVCCRVTPLQKALVSGSTEETKKILMMPRAPPIPLAIAIRCINLCTSC